MTQETNLALARRLLAAIGGGADPVDVAALFHQDALFEIPGDDGALPWIGHQRGHPAIIGFVHGLRTLTEPVKMEVQDVLAGPARAVILGELATRVKATGRMIGTAFAIVLTISDGLISRFQMLEDSFDVSRAARP